MLLGIMTISGRKPEAGQPVCQAAGSAIELPESGLRALVAHSRLFGILTGRGHEIFGEIQGIIFLYLFTHWKPLAKPPEVAPWPKVILWSGAPLGSLLIITLARL
jgi:hypothetical protein